jgi:HSP20 family protein
MDEKYFENLAKGKKADFEISEEEIDIEETKENEDHPTIDAIAHEMGNYGVELARANSSAITSRSTSRKTSRTSSAPADTTATAKADSWDNDASEGQLTLDVYQTPTDIVIESAIAGVRPENIDINVTTDSISIKGVRHREQEVGDEDYLYRECYWGRFARSIILPQEVDPERAEVSFRNGILIVRLPKTNRQKSRKLRVRID